MLVEGNTAFIIFKCKELFPPLNSSPLKVLSFFKILHCFHNYFQNIIMNFLAILHTSFSVKGKCLNMSGSIGWWFRALDKVPGIPCGTTQLTASWLGGLTQVAYHLCLLILNCHGVSRVIFKPRSSKVFLWSRFTEVHEIVQNMMAAID